jgi:hypothetical protein
VEDFTREPWFQEAVQLRLPSGRHQYLIQAKRERCEHCARGVRTVSLWAASRGRGELVAWCAHCFNATCETVRLEEEHCARLQAARAAVSCGKVSKAWTAARPALEDLERRGLL